MTVPSRVLDDARAIDWDALTGAITGNPDLPTRSWDLPLMEDMDPDMSDELAGHDRGDDWNPDWDRPDTLAGEFPATETLAWYQPITFYGAQWGIVLTERGINTYARSIRRAFASDRKAPQPTDPVGQSRAIAILLLLAHERFHHRAESFALRQHAVTYEPIYTRYERQIYTPLSHPPDDALLEEALASADEYWSVDLTTPYGTVVTPSLRKAIRRYLDATYSMRPPGYRHASAYVIGKEAFEAGCAELRVTMSAGAIRIGAPRGCVNPEPWGSKGLFDQLAIDNARLLPHLPGGTVPFALSIPNKNLERLLAQHGYSKVPKQGKGSHVKWATKAGDMITLPARKDQSGYSVLTSVARAVHVSSIHDLKVIATHA